MYIRNAIDYNIGDKLTCSVCNKEFKVSDDTKYICNGGYVCSWKCFINHIRSKPDTIQDSSTKETNKTNLK